MYIYILKEKDRQYLSDIYLYIVIMLYVKANINRPPGATDHR